MPGSSNVKAMTLTSAEILQSARLELLVPHASAIDSAELILSLEGGGSDAPAIDSLASITQRRSLFYGEQCKSHSSLIVTST